MGKATRKEKLGGYFYNLSQLTFAATVLGALTPLLESNDGIVWLKMALGAAVTALFAWIGNRVLKE